MPKKLKTYPMSMDPDVYKLVRAIAEAQGITMKEVFRVSMGLYIAHNHHAFDIIKRGEATTVSPRTTLNTSHKQENKND